MYICSNVSIVPDLSEVVSDFFLLWRLLPTFLGPTFVHRRSVFGTFRLFLACCWPAFVCFWPVLSGMSRPCFCAQAQCFGQFRLFLACFWPASGLLLLCSGLPASCLFLCTGAAFYARPVCSWIASCLLLACFVWRASCLLVAVFLHRRGGLCTSGLLCLACCWPALSGLCCLGLACFARAVARKSLIFDRTARGERQLSDKSSAPRPVFGQLSL